MKIIITILIFIFASEIVDASILDVFKDERGKTKWQNIANFTGSVFIVLLTITLISLTVSQFKLRARNLELREIKKGLEDKVLERTENLKQSNRLLQKANRLLEGEIEQHKETSSRLFSSQNYMKSILTSMPSMLICLNEKYDITHWNHTAEKVTGISSEQALGRNLWEAYPSITIAQDQVNTVLGSEKPKEIKHSQRGKYYFDISIYPLTDNDGVVIIIEDITQRSLAEKMLIQRDKMTSVGELASTMAHDINIPLQAMLSNVKALLRQEKNVNTPNENQTLLESSIQFGEQASSIIENLLSFSQSRTSEKKEESIIDILEHCIELGSSMLAESEVFNFKNVVIEKQYATDIPKVHCYSVEIQQVFLSLFRHASHYMAAKKAETKADYTPTLTIEVMNAYDNVWVKIQHNGVGLSADEQHDLFEPIIQHTAEEHPKAVLTENRLSFSYFIIAEHHQGQMAVTSDPDVGTTFHIQFDNELSKHKG